MSNGRIAVLCPTRDRPEGLVRLFRSVAETADVGTVFGGGRVRVLPYVDSDQRDEYRSSRYDMPGVYDGPHIDRGDILSGPRIGPVGSANRLVEYHLPYDVYGLITDDSIITTPGWDEWVLETVKQFPNKIVVISPHHNMGNHVDMPFVTREWIETVGWFACPDCYHYAWPTITGLIGEMTAIVHAPEHKFHIEHSDHVQDKDKQIRDAQPFYEFVSLKLPAVVERLRSAMYPATA